MLVSTSFQKTHTKAMKHIKEINGKDYEFDVTTLNIKVAEYNGFWGTDLDVTALIKCNGNESEFKVRICYPAGEVFDYYSQWDFKDLAEMYGEPSEEIEQDFELWYKKHGEELEKNYLDDIIDYLFEEEGGIQNDVLEYLINSKITFERDEFLSMLISDNDMIETAVIDRSYICLPTFMDDFESDEELNKLPYYIKAYPRDYYDVWLEKQKFTLVVNTYLKFDVDIYLSKYLAVNCEVGTGWCHVFEEYKEFLFLLFKHEGITTVKELRDYLENSNYTLKLDEYGC